MADEYKNNGGPAFPMQSIGPEFAPGYEGMTLRDYFAGQALPAVISATSAGTHQPGLSNPDIAGRPIEDRIAYDAYRLADAMLKERSK